MRVAAYKRDGRLFAEFRSISEASRILGIQEKDIKRALIGKKASVVAYMFKFIDREEDYILVGRA